MSKTGIRIICDNFGGLLTAILDLDDVVMFVIVKKYFLGFGK